MPAHLNSARSLYATSKSWRHFFRFLFSFSFFFILFLFHSLSFSFSFFFILFLSCFKSSTPSLKCVKIVIEHNYVDIGVTWCLIWMYWSWICLGLGCQIFPDVACHRKILDLGVKCSYVECPWTGELRAVQVIYLRHIHSMGILHHSIFS